LSGKEKERRRDTEYFTSKRKKGKFPTAKKHDIETCAEKLGGLLGEAGRTRESEGRCATGTEIEERTSRTRDENFANISSTGSHPGGTGKARKATRPRNKR